ncbi:uncharacterized protein LOC144881909 [Branchiostoma floridae x Branchiostoma japonicum]
MDGILQTSNLTDVFQKRAMSPPPSRRKRTDSEPQCGRRRSYTSPVPVELERRHHHHHHHRHRKHSEREDKERSPSEASASPKRKESNLADKLHLPHLHLPSFLTPPSRRKHYEMKAEEHSPPETKEEKTDEHSGSDDNGD